MLPRRKRICDSREPVRTRIGKVRGLISRKSGPRIALRHLVEGARLVGDDAGEDVEPAGRAFRIGARRDVGGQVEAFDQRHDVDAARLQHRAVGESEIRAARAAAASRLTEKSGPGRKLARTRVALAPSRRSRLAGCTWLSAGGSAMPDRAIGDQPPDRAVGQDALSVAVHRAHRRSRALPDRRH